MTIATIPLSHVEPNPYRNFAKNPLRDDHIAHLRASISSTSFWGGIMVRPHPSRRGHYQLAFGHARFQAALDEGIKRADFVVRDDLDDDAMVRAMADENITQFGRDEYATYREAVSAAIERIMGETLEGRCPENIFSTDRQNEITRTVEAIKRGDAPGLELVAPTVAAATYIMREVLEGRGGNFTAPSSRRSDAWASN